MADRTTLRATGRLTAWYTDERVFEFQRASDRMTYVGDVHPAIARGPAVVGGPRTATALIDDDGERFLLVGWAPEGKEPVAAPPLPPPMEQARL